MVQAKVKIMQAGNIACTPRKKPSMNSFNDKTLRGTNIKKATIKAPVELNTKAREELVLPKAAPKVWYCSSSPQ